jgi:hypothetical protein
MCDVFCVRSYFRLQVADIDQTILVTNHLRHTPSLLRHTLSPLRHTQGRRRRHTVRRHTTKVRKAEAVAEDSLKMTKMNFDTFEAKNKPSFQNFSIPKHTNFIAICSYSPRRVRRLLF